jgi:hypothetical protein
MTKIVANTRAAQTVTPDIICDNIKQAKTSFVLSKDAAGEAAARAYLVWFDTMSANAHVDMIKWMDDEIAKRNPAIDAHNKEEKDLKEKSNKFVNGKLAEDNWLNGTPETKAERDELAAEKARLTSLHALSKDEWAARRKVKVEAREGASKFTKLVKFVFDFEYASDSSVTSRYATVLEWVDAKFGGEIVEDASQITDTIKAAGGFEAVLNLQRGNKPEDDTAAADRKAIADAIAKQAKAAVQNADAKATFAMDVKNAPEGIVLVLGRYVDGKVEVVGEMPLVSERLDEVVSQFNDEDLLPTNDHAEFVARVLALGELVNEGSASDITEDGVKAGKKEAERRTLTLAPNAAAGLELVVSARFADASAVIKATPRLERVVLGEVTTPMLMPWVQSRALTKMLDDRSTRRLVDVISDVNEGELSWIVGNSALIAVDSKNARQCCTLDSLVNETHMPLDVDGFKPQFAVTVAVAELRGLYQTCLTPWKETKDGKKNQKQMALTFKDGQMTYQFDGKSDHSLPCAGANPVPVSLQFRSQDLHDLVLALTQQQVASVKVSGDSSGLLCVTWSDHLGHYSVYLPTATKDNKLEHRRVAPMRIEVDLPMAA